MAEGGSAAFGPTLESLIREHLKRRSYIMNTRVIGSHATRRIPIPFLAAMLAALLSLTCMTVGIIPAQAQDQSAAMPSVTIGKHVDLPVEGTMTSGYAPSIDGRPIRWISDDGRYVVVDLMDESENVYSSLTDMTTGKTIRFNAPTMTVLDGSKVVYGPDANGQINAYDIGAGTTTPVYGIMVGVGHDLNYKYAPNGTILIGLDGYVRYADLHEALDNKVLMDSVPVPSNMLNWFPSADGKTVYMMTRDNGGSTVVQAIDLSTEKTRTVLSVKGTLEFDTRTLAWTPFPNGVALGSLGTPDSDDHTTMRVDLANGTVAPLSTSAAFDLGGGDRYRVLYESGDGSPMTQSDSTYDLSRKDLASMKLATYDVESGTRLWETKMPELLARTPDANIGAVRVSPDGRHAFVFRGLSTDGNTNDLHVIDLTTGEESGSVSIPAEDQVSDDGLIMSGDGKVMVGLTVQNGKTRLTQFDIAQTSDAAAPQTQPDAASGQATPGAAPSSAAPSPSQQPDGSAATRAHSGSTPARGNDGVITVIAIAAIVAGVIGVVVWQMRKTGPQSQTVAQPSAAPNPMPYCIRCGKPTLPGMRYCIHCGKPLMMRRD